MNLYKNYGSKIMNDCKHEKIEFNRFHFMRKSYSFKCLNCKKLAFIKESKIKIMEFEEKFDVILN